MQIEAAIQEMTLVQLHELLQQPAKISFGYFSIGARTFSFSPYQGSLSLAQIAKRVSLAYAAAMQDLTKNFARLSLKALFGYRQQLSYAKQAVAALAKLSEQANRQRQTINCVAWIYQHIFNKLDNQWRYELFWLENNLNADERYLNIIPAFLRTDDFLFKADEGGKAFFANSASFTPQGSPAQAKPASQPSVDHERFDPYEILAISRQAGWGQIKAAYRQAVLKVHPDKNPNDPQAAAKFQAVQKAFNRLKEHIPLTK